MVEASKTKKAAQTKGTKAYEDLRQLRITLMRREREVRCLSHRWASPYSIVDGNVGWRQIACLLPFETRLVLQESCWVTCVSSNRRWPPLVSRAVRFKRRCCVNCC
jgi:hypothetical protein